MNAPYPLDLRTRVNLTRDSNSRLVLTIQESDKRVCGTKSGHLVSCICSPFLL